MAVLAKWFGQALKGQFSATEPRRVDWVNDVVRVALVKSTYVPNQDTDDFWNDVSANEASGAGYVAGGKVLAEKTLTYDAASNTLRLDAADVEWAEVSVKARYAVVYKEQGAASESPVLGYVDFGKDEEAAAGVFKIEWDAVDGVLRVKVGE